MSIETGNRLGEIALQWSRRLEEFERDVSRCPDCRRVRYYEGAGPECPGFSGYSGLPKEEVERRMSMAMHNRRRRERKG